MKLNQHCEATTRNSIAKQPRVGEQKYAIMMPGAELSGQFQVMSTKIG